jgi:hypothetical protein
MIVLNCAPEIADLVAHEYRASEPTAKIQRRLFAPSKCKRGDEMSLMRTLRSALACLTIPLSFAAQGQASVAKGQLVALRIPLAALKYEHDKFLGSVTLSNGFVSVNDTQDWWRIGLAAAKPLKVSDIRTDPKTGKLVVRLDGGALSVVDIFFTIDLADTAVVFREIFGGGTDAEAARAASERKIEDWLFADSTKLSQAARDRLMSVGADRQKWDTVTDVLQERRYLRLTAPEPKYTYNNSQTSVAERQAGTINEVAFPLIKELGKASPSYPTSLGFVVVIAVKSKDMVGQYSWLNPTAHDDLRIYVPATVAGEFARAEITNQDLVDKSVVLFKGNRIKVDLTK